MASCSSADALAPAAPAGARRVLMISPHFPPDGSAAAHRVRLLAPNLPRFGWSPTVLTMTADAYDTVDGPLAALVPTSVDVRRVRPWPLARTRPFGIGDLGLRALAPLWREADALLARERFDVLFITVYPVYPALLGPRLKRRHGVPFVLDYQDPWVGSWGLRVGPARDGGPNLKSRLSRAIGVLLEPRVVRAADAVTAVSERTYLDALARANRAQAPPVATLPIGWERRDRDAICTTPNRWFDPADGCVHFCYVGTLLPNGFGTLRALIAALALLRRQAPATYGRVRLHFFGTSNQFRGGCARVLPVAADYGVSDLVSEEPDRIPYVDALQVLAEASAVLVLGSSEPHYTASKVFPALLSGRPVVAIVHEASSVGPMVRAAGSAPAVYVATYATDPTPEQIVPVLRDAVATARSSSGPSDLSALEPVSARALAGDLARLFDHISCPRPILASV